MLDDAERQQGWGGKGEGVKGEGVRGKSRVRPNPTRHSPHPTLFRILLPTTYSCPIPIPCAIVIRDRVGHTFDQHLDVVGNGSTGVTCCRRWAVNISGLKPV